MVDLKSEREKKKISLSQIADDTRISLRYLQSIEEGRYSDLPGGVYNRAFLKAYCESINIDPQEVLEHYEAQENKNQLEGYNKANIPLVQQKSFSIPTSILIWSIMLLLSAVGIYFSRGWISSIFSPYFTEKRAIDVIDNTPETVPVSSGTEAAGNTLPPVAENAPTSENTAEAAALPGKQDLSVTNTGTPESTLSSNSFNKQVPSGEVSSKKLHLEITAIEQCWVSIDIDGTPSSRKLMEPGETLLFHAQDNFRILLGNAGGIRMKINDKPTKDLGEPGEVIRMNIDTKNLQQFMQPSAG